jgi:hypothetical protein
LRLKLGATEANYRAGAIKEIKNEVNSIEM